MIQRHMQKVKLRTVKDKSAVVVDTKHMLVIQKFSIIEFDLSSSTTRNIGT